MSRSKYIFYTSLLILSGTTLFTACEEKKEAHGSNKHRGLSAEGYIVQPGSFAETYTASGSLLPNEQVNLLPEITGRVTGIHFKEGSHVKKGQLLVQLYDKELKAQLTKLKAQRQLQQKTEERQLALLEIGGISKQDFETTQTQIQSIDADIAFTEAQLRATQIIAPFSGKIGIRNISPGAVVTPNTVITTLQQNNPLKIDFDIPDQYRDAIKDGNPVLLSISGRNDSLNGTIVAYDPGANTVTRTIRARAIIPNTDKELIAGSFARVHIPLESDSNAILVPSRAVIPTTKDKLIAVVRNGQAELKTVKLGTRTENKVEILSGLQKGDTILTTGLMQVKTGMPVTITKING